MKYCNKFGVQAIRHLCHTERTDNQNITCYDYKNGWGKKIKGNGSPLVLAGEHICSSQKKKKIMIKKEWTIIH